MFACATVALSPPIIERIAVRVGTRGSALALVQAERVIAALRRVDDTRAYEIVVISTVGDTDKTTPLTIIGGQGVFTVALQDALLRGDADLAVHSAKDLPPVTPPGLVLAAYPERGDPRDVFISRHDLPLAHLPPGAIVGTSSRRRGVQARAINAGIDVAELRGNLDTRLRKATGEPYDGIIVAAAGLERMGWSARVTEYLPVSAFVPAPAQGAIAVECRADDAEIAVLVAQIDDADTRVTVAAERAALMAVGAGCRAPFACYAALRGDHLALWGMMAEEDGTNARWQEEIAPAADPGTAGRHIAALLAVGAGARA